MALLLVARQDSFCWLVVLTLTLSGSVFIGPASLDKGQHINSSQEDLMASDQELTDVQKGCPNWQGVTVADGEKYVPSGNDMCMQCICDKGFATACQSVACSPPLHCPNSQQVKEACCEYICLDDRVPNDRNMTDVASRPDKDDGESITNLSLRLIASTVTSFLVLALLLFMVHRLRQRRLLLAMRRFEAQSRQTNTEDTESDPYIPDSFLAMECPPYTDPPPPYSPPKPAQIMPGEQPPSYDEVTQAADQGNSDENRNQIRGVGVSSSGQVVPAEPGGHRRVVHREITQAETDQGQQYPTFEPRVQRSGPNNLCPADTLPAYASTDLVDGLGVVISPGSETASYSPGWSNTWLSAPAQTQTLAHQTSAAGPQWNSSSFEGSGCRLQTLPTTTAFSRFSNIFRKNSWKIKNLRCYGRHCPPHYSTVPRNDQGSYMGEASLHLARRNKMVSSPYSSGFPEVAFNYGTQRSSSAATSFPQNATSPSTSSSYSSEQQVHSSGSTVSSTTQGTASSGCGLSPPEGSFSSVDHFLLSPLHRQQFHQDLQRHLPPVRFSDSKEIPSHYCRDNNSGCSSFLNQPSQNVIPQNFTSVIGHETSSCVREHPLMERTHLVASHAGEIRQSPAQGEVQVTCPTLTHASTHYSDCVSQPPVASLLPPVPASTVTAGGTEGSFAQAFVDSEPLPRARSPKVLAAAGQCSPLYNCSTSQVSVQNFPPTSLPCCDPRGFQELTSAQPFIACSTSCTAMTTWSSSLPGSAETLNSSPSNSPPRPNKTGTQTSSSASMSPSPSPPLSSCGILRRSQSAASQASMFSVCSETGEKKLKAGDLFEFDAKVYPHLLEKNCLSRLASGQCAEPIRQSETRAVLASTRKLCPEHHGTDLTDGAFGCAACDKGDQLSNLAPDPLRPCSGVGLVATDNRTNLGTVTEVASCACSQDQTVCHPSAIMSRSMFTSSQEDPTWQVAKQFSDRSGQVVGSSHNLNSLLDKNMTGKNVPFFSPELAMSQSVNIPPLPAVPGVHSCPTVKLTAQTQGDRAAGSKSTKSHEMIKKLNKKRLKERSSPQVAGLVRQTCTSPKHLSLKLGAPAVTCPQKPECALKDKEVAGRVMRPVQNKYRNHQAVSRPGVRVADSVNSSKVRSVSECPATYGNADVYRNHPGECLPALAPLPHPAFVPWSQAGLSVGCDSGLTSVAPINDLNQPPSYFRSSMEHCSPTHNVAVCDDPSAGRDARKKGCHKRQLSSNDKLSQNPSPSRHKYRPKSLQAPDVTSNEKRFEVFLPRQNVGTADSSVAGKGARSGFGHDLNFDDQNGLVDLHISETDFGIRRVSVVQETHAQLNLDPVRKLSRTDGTGDTSCAALKKDSGAAVGYHPGSKSGLSNDLSFTCRPTLAGSHNKKRQPLPVAISTTSMGVLQDRGSIATSNGVSARTRQVEVEGHVAQMRSERSGGVPERRGEKSIFVDGFVEATSYV